MYLETAIAERQTSFPSIHSGTHSISPPLLLFFSSPFVLTIRLLAARICEAFFVSEEEEEEEEEEGQILARIFSRASEAPKIRTPLPKCRN
jgi:hypothetical protein